MTVNAEAPQVYLASGSPRRRDLLDQIGIRYEVVPVDVDERPRHGEPPRTYAARLALAKARTARDRGDLRRPVVGADTVVTIDGDILGKPAHCGEAAAMLARLAGRTHRVMTAVAVIAAVEAVAVGDARVTFRPIDADEARAYWATGEPVGKAGGYAIQGRGALFVSRLEGSYSAVVGLPLFETARLLQACGVALWPSRAAVGS